MKQRKHSSVNHTLTRAVLVRTAALSIGFAAPTVAQQPAVDLAMVVDEIIVTARRREESVQDVPISMTVFNQEQLTDKNVLSGRDLATYTPSLSVNGRYGTENASFALRGFSQEIRTAPSVAIYFADVVAPRGSGAGTPSGDGAGPGAFFDLQNVQVLKGPQGTLFGRNTTGGAILLVPQKPTSEFEGYVEQSAGNYSMLRTQAIVNVPFSDSVRFRAGVDYNKRDGYIENTSGVGPDDFLDVDYVSGRASLVVDITANLENYTIGSYSRSDTNGQVPRLFVCNPAFDPRRGPSGGLACAQLAANAAAGTTGRFDVQNDNNESLSRTERWQLINTTTWLATDQLTVKNIVSYAELENDLDGDLFGTRFFRNGLPVYSNASKPPPGLHSTNQSTLSEELQFQGNAQNGRLVWQAGGYFESSEGIDPTGSQSPSFINCTDSATLNCFDVIGQASGRPFGSVNWQVGTIDFRNYGVYLQSTYSLTDRLNVTGGIRYTEDRAESDTEIALHRFPAPNYNAPVVFCANTDSGHSYTEVVSSVHDCRVQYSKSSSAPTWVLGLDYALTQDLMVYGKYSRGYRQGSVQPFSVPGFNTYDPEEVDSYELGFKSSFSGAVHGTFNVSAFYNDFTDQQLLYGFGSTRGAPGNAAIINAGSSRIYGAEVESTLVPFRGLDVSLSYAYLNTQIEELTAPMLDPTSLYDIASQITFAGDPLPYSTKHKVSATVNYTLPLDASIGAVSVGATYTYQSDMFIASARSNPFYGTIPSYELVNLNLNWNDIAGSGFGAGLFVTNVFDKEYRVGITNSWSSFGFETEIPGEPRMWGARLRYRFGN